MFKSPDEGRRQGILLNYNSCCTVERTSLEGSSVSTSHEFKGPLNVVPFEPLGIQSLLSSAPFRWWITGGWALDLFAGERSRPHFDIDVAIARRDQALAQRHFHVWDFQYAVPGTSDPVLFKSWQVGQILGFEIHGSWARETPDSPWRFEFLLHEIDQDVWSFRYCLNVQHPLKCVGGCTSDSFPYLQPEIALLYKAARLRQVDEQDFLRVLPLLTTQRRVQLAQDILQFSPEHPWIALLR
jgi:hypothetical protein